MDGGGLWGQGRGDGRMGYRIQNTTHNGKNLCVQLVPIASDPCTQDKHIRTLNIYTVSQLVPTPCKLWAVVT